jgi:hypothetical protein
MGKIAVLGEPRQKVSKTSQPINQTWWCMSVIPAIQEALGR